MTRPAATVLLAALLAAPAHATDGLVVVAPHPDDEVLAAAGILDAARRAGREVAVIVVTNGDYFGTDYGITREGESVDALGMLDVPEERVVFLGYPDSGLLPLWNNAPAAGQAYLSPRSGRDATYGTRGRGHADFHTAIDGAPGSYNQPTLVADVRDALALFRPSDVFTTGVFDDNPDHRGTLYAVREALRQLAAADGSYRPTLHTTVVHDPVHHPFDDFWPASAPRETPFVPGNDDLWPNPSAASGVPNRFDPTVPFAVPPSLGRTIADWASRVSTPVPRAMALPDFATNLKVQSLYRYATQRTDVLWSHVKADEFFWEEPVRLGAFTRNVARAATATATTAAGQGAAGAIDGIIDGAPANPAAEWAAAGPDPGAALALAWRVPVLVDRVVLFDRIGMADHVTAGRLHLDDGTEARFGTLANDGRGDEIVLAEAHRITALGVVVDAAVGTPGLAELQVFGTIAPIPCDGDAVCDDGDPCTTGVCRAGLCAFDPVADGTPCGDGDDCNGFEVCAAGECTRNPPPSCDDADPCTRDGCASPGTCTHERFCRPEPAHGRGHCRLGIVGVPARTCEDGDAACDRDETTNGTCRFDVILCVNSGPATPGCRLSAPLAGLRVKGRDPALRDTVARLVARLPTGAETCVGPKPVQVVLGRHRVVSRRVTFYATTADHRHLHAHIALRCAAAPPGVVRRPPAPPAP